MVPEVDCCGGLVEEAPGFRTLDGPDMTLNPKSAGHTWLPSRGGVDEVEIDAWLSDLLQV